MDPQEAIFTAELEKTFQYMAMPHMSEFLNRLAEGLRQNDFETEPVAFMDYSDDRGVCLNGIHKTLGFFIEVELTMESSTDHNGTLEGATFALTTNILIGEKWIEMHSLKYAPYNNTDKVWCPLLTIPSRWDEFNEGFDVSIYIAELHYWMSNQTFTLSVA